MTARNNGGPGYDPADLADIPGTPIFTLVSSRRSYHLHRFCISLMKPDNRDAFRADERGYLDLFPMAPEQKDAVLARDYGRLIELDANIFFLVKLAFTDGWSTQKAVGSMTGMSAEDYAQMMLAGGRSPEGVRSIRGGY
jgi:protocatechuate 4,5-dioxygenase, alpha chain